MSGTSVTYGATATEVNTGSTIAARLKPSERESLQSLQKEKATKGYAGQVDQYYRNLAEDIK